MKRASNNITRIVEDSEQVWTSTSTITRPIKVDFEEISASYDPRQNTFPQKGKQDLINSFTGESLKRHREGYIFPQSSSNY